MDDRGSLVYKCRNCGKKHSEVSYPDATKITVEIVTTGIKMFSMHRCLNGNLGISDLIYVETTDKERHKISARLARIP
jgi:DNA-directed RNA polymerase subunit RPC12/RpoP